MVIKKIVFGVVVVLLYDYPNITLILFIILQCLSLVFTIIVRPYDSLYILVIHTCSNSLLIAGLGMRISLHNQMMTLRENPSDEFNMDGWNNNGYVVVYMEWIAVMMECALFFFMIAHQSYKNRQFSKRHPPTKGEILAEDP
jgi:magnesium-transporting ATPase (P-type)